MALLFKSWFKIQFMTMDFFLFLKSVRKQNLPQLPHVCYIRNPLSWAAGGWRDGFRGIRSGADMVKMVTAAGTLGLCALSTSS